MKNEVKVGKVTISERKHVVRIALSDARNNFRAILGKTEFDKITFILTYYGRDVAVLIPVDEAREYGIPVALSRRKRRMGVEKEYDIEMEGEE